MKICFVAPRVYPLFYNGNALEQIGGAELQQKLISEALTSKNIQVFFTLFEKISSTDRGNPGYPTGHRGFRYFLYRRSPGRLCCQPEAGGTT